MEKINRFATGVIMTHKHTFTDTIKNKSYRISLKPGDPYSGPRHASFVTMGLAEFVYADEAKKPKKNKPTETKVVKPKEEKKSLFKKASKKA